MNIAPWLARAAGRALGPFGELGCDVLLERSLLDEIPAVPPHPEVSLRLAGAADLDQITRLYSSDPWLYILEGPTLREGLPKARELYLERLERGELGLDAYLDARVSEATRHLTDRLGPAQLELVRQTLRSELSADPVLVELVRRATGKTVETG